MQAWSGARREIKSCRYCKRSICGVFVSQALISSHDKTTQTTTSLEDWTSRPAITTALPHPVPTHRGRESAVVTSCNWHQVKRHSLPSQLPKRVPLVPPPHPRTANLCNQSSTHPCLTHQVSLQCILGLMHTAHRTLAPCRHECERVSRPSNWKVERRVPEEPADGKTRTQCSMRQAARVMCSRLPHKPTCCTLPSTDIDTDSRQVTCNHRSPRF